MFDNIGWAEILALVVIGLFVFGPERLPKVIADAARFLRTVRTMARNATTELRDELGTDIDLADLNPKTFVRKHLLSEDDEEALRRPVREAMRDLSELSHADDVAEAHRGAAGRDASPAADPPVDHPMDRQTSPSDAAPPPARYDTDAT